MAKKKATKRATETPAKRSSSSDNPPGVRSKVKPPADYGIDLGEIVQEIKSHLAGMTQKEIAEAMDTTPMVVSHWMTGNRVPSIGALAALAELSGGRLVVRYAPPGE